jgi:hypothetical protein
MTIKNSALLDLAPTPYPQVRDFVREGDLLLCSATDRFSRVIRWATRSPWSHVAIAFPLREIGRVMVLECVENLGVRAVPLSQFISRTSSGVAPYPGKILLARHCGLAARRNPHPMKAMAQFAFGRLGARFSRMEIAKIILRILAGRLGRRLPPVLEADDEFICSEYVARCYGEVGIRFAWDGLGFIAPADIARDPEVEPVAVIDTSDLEQGASAGEDRVLRLVAETSAASGASAGRRLEIPAEQRRLGLLDRSPSPPG